MSKIPEKLVHPGTFVDFDDALQFMRFAPDHEEVSYEDYIRAIAALEDEFLAKARQVRELKESPAKKSAGGVRFV